jgi:hypothetical protein
VSGSNPRMIRIARIDPVLVYRSLNAVLCQSDAARATHGLRYADSAECGRAGAKIVGAHQGAGFGVGGFGGGWIVMTLTSIFLQAVSRQTPSSHTLLLPSITPWSLNPTNG